MVAFFQKDHLTCLAGFKKIKRAAKQPATPKIPQPFSQYKSSKEKMTCPVILIRFQIN
jgi:hypothetical protein